MRYLITLLFILFISTAGKTQNLDSFLAIPQTLELTLSTPQPRLKEKFQASLEIAFVRAHIFRSAFGKIELADEIGNSDNDKMILNINAIKKGKNEIGPLNFTINGVACTTNKIVYEVIDPLPNVDKGLWFRKVNTSDSTFCIIIEQRIPASEKKTINSERSFTLTTEPEYDKIVKFKDAYSIAGLSGLNSRSSTNFGSIYDKDDHQKQFMSGYSVYYFTIQDKKIKIKITKDKFENLPDDYKFEDIVIQ